MTMPHRATPKPLASLLTCASLALCAALAPPAHAIDYPGYQPGDQITFEEAQRIADIQLEHYEKLGLTLDTNDLGKDLVAPLPEDRVTDIFVPREVYTAANGNHGNGYIVRDYLDVLGPTSRDGINNTTWVNDDYGQMLGAYGWYRLSTDWPDTKKGGGTASFLHSNDKGILSKGGMGFAGKYATSAPVSLTAGGESKESGIAELRAFGNDKYTDLPQAVNGRTRFLGALEVHVAQFSTTGARTLKATLRPTVNASQLYDDSFKFLHADYLQENDAYFEIETGDVDGDGISEIFVYAGAYEDKNDVRYAIVDMFRSTDGEHYERTSKLVAAGPASSYAKESKITRGMMLRTAPVVTMAAGDIDRDGSDELAVTVSAPAGNSDVGAVGGCELFTWEDPNLTSMHEFERLSLTITSDGKGLGMASANCTFGTFAVPGKGSGSTYYTTALIIAGWQTLGNSTEDATTYSSMGYRYVYYDPNVSKFVSSTYLTHVLGKDGRHIADSATHRASKKGRYMPTLAPLALGCAHLESPSVSASQTDHVLAGGDVWSFNLISGFSAQPVGSMSICAYHYNMKGLEHKDVDQVWIGDVVSGIVSNDELYHESFLAVVGLHRDEAPGSKDDYYWMDLSHFTFGDGDPSKVRTGQEGVICESNRVNPHWGTFISLCLPDIDKDGVRMRFVGKTTIVSEPKAVAIIQDAPYYAELEEAYSYIANGSTSFGTGKGHAATNGVYVSGKAGLGIDAQLDLFIALHLAGSIQAAGSFDYQHTAEVAYSSNCTVGAGAGNKVLAGMDPCVYYFYEIWDPEKQAWDGTCSLPIRCGEITSLISIDRWNSVADTTTSMKRISSDIISSVSGDPTTYPNSLYGSAKMVYPEKSSQLGYEQMSTYTEEGRTTKTQTIGKSQTDDFHFTVGLAAALTFMGGGGIGDNKIMAGIVIDGELGYTHTESNVKNTSFSGTMDGLPTLTSLNPATPGEYGFKWKLVVKQLEAKKDGNPFGDTWLVGYDVPVESVTPPALGMLGGCRVCEATDTSLTLEWLPSNFGGSIGDDCWYEVYLMQDNDPDAVASSRRVRAENLNTAVRLTYDGLDPQHAYTFKICAIKGSEKDGTFTYTATSIPSKQAVGSTLGAGEKCAVGDISTDPDPASVDPGEDITFTASGSWTKETAEGIQDLSNNINYRWYKKAPGDTSWKQVNGNALATMVSYDCETEDLDEDGFLTPVLEQQSADENLDEQEPVAEGQDASDDAIVDAESAEDEQELLEAQAEATQSTLTLKNLKAENDGTLIKCVLGYNAYAQETEVIKISVSQNPVTQQCLYVPALRAEASTSEAAGTFASMGHDVVIGDVEEEEQKNEENKEEEKHEEKQDNKKDEKNEQKADPSKQTTKATSTSKPLAHTADQTHTPVVWAALGLAALLIAHTINRKQA